jgi:hypothetical protein
MFFYRISSLLFTILSLFFVMVAFFVSTTERADAKQQELKTQNPVEVHVATLISERFATPLRYSARLAA